MMTLLQIQRSVQEKNWRMGAVPVPVTGDHQQLAGRSEPVDLPGGGVHEQWCVETAAGRGEEVRERRQVVAARAAEGPRHAERRRVLRRRRLRRSDATTSTRAARALPEVTHRVLAQRLRHALRGRRSGP